MNLRTIFPRASERRVLLIVGVRYTFSHLLIFTSSRLHMPSSHIHIFTFSHLHIFTSSYLHISSSHIFASSHLLIFTSTHIVFTYSHLILTYHLRIFTSTHTIFTSSHLRIFTSYPHVFTSSLSLSLFFFSLLRPRAVLTRRHEMATLSHEMMVDRQKLK